MSIIATTGWGALGQATAGAAGVQTRMDTLTAQASSGLVANDYAGLAPAAARISLDLTPEIAHLQTWQNNISAATGQMGVAQSALSQVSAIAANFQAQLSNINSVNPGETDTIAADARQALVQVAGLLDTQDGGVYVFGGTDSTNPPVPQPDNILQSGLFTQIQTAVGGLASNGASATAASTLAIASSNAAGTSPFSATLSQPASSLAGNTPVVATGAGQVTQIGILASANGFVASTGTSTTGSYMRDVMRALATIGSLSSAQFGAGADVSGLVADTTTSLQGAVTALNQDAGVLGDQQTALGTVQTGLAGTATALTTQAGAADNVDMAQTLSNLTQVQTQLQASYQLIASISKLSLAQYL